MLRMPKLARQAGVSVLRADRGTAAHNRDHRSLALFEETRIAADWRHLQELPLFRGANRMHADNTDLLMEQERP